MKTLFILNPKSGRRGTRGSLQSLIEQVYPTIDSAFSIYRCGDKDDLDGVIRRALAESYQLIFAVGGDGTVREVAVRLIGTPAVLGILPAGSGNGFARHLQIPLAAEAALRSVAKSRIEAIDTAAVNQFPFINVAGLGFDAMVAGRFASSRRRGVESYVREGVKALASYAAEEYEIEFEGKRLRKKAYLIAVANASQYGGGARIAPLASLQDGLLDLALVHHRSWFDTPLLLQQLFSGRLHESPHVTTLQVSEATIRRDAEGPAHVDGEPATLPAEVHFRIQPRSLRVLVPATASGQL